MSLTRTALRLAAVAALEADPVVGAFCRGRIFESRIDEIDASEVAPVLIVFTGDERGRAWSANNGGPPFDASVDLNFEISMRIRVAADAESPGATPDIGVAETDRELEAALDLLEDAAIAAVTVADTAPAQLLRDVVTRRVTEFRSTRYASADTGAKLAMRLTTLTVELQGDDRPDPFTVPIGPFASLPDPLRSVAAALDPASSGYATCQALAARMGAPSVPLPFAGAAAVTYAAAALDPAIPPNPTDPNVPTFGQRIDIP